MAGREAVGARRPHQARMGTEPGASRPSREEGELMKPQDLSVNSGSARIRPGRPSGSTHTSTRAARSVPAVDTRSFDTSMFADLERRSTSSSPAEHVLVLLALAPHLRPDFYARLIAQHLPEGGDLPEFGGVRGEHHRGVLPTGETAQFLLAGDDLAGRLEVQRLLSSEHWFAKRHVLWLDPVRAGRTGDERAADPRPGGGRAAHHRHGQPAPVQHRLPGRAHRDGTRLGRSSCCSRTPCAS